MLPFFALDPKKTAKEARRLMEEGKWEKGYSLCKKALKNSPKDPDLLEISCELSLLLKKYKEAIAHFTLLKKHPERRKRLLNILFENFGGDEEDKVLLREHVLLELLSEGELDKIENVFPLIPENEKEHFLKKHSERDDFYSQFLLYVLLFYSRKFMDASLKLYEIYKRFEDKRTFVKKEILRIQNMGFIRKYANFVNFLISYSEGEEKKAVEYVVDLIEDDFFYPYILREFEKRFPENSYFRLLFSHLLIMKGEKGKGLSVLKEIVKDKENIDKNYAYDIVKGLKREELSDDEIKVVAEILTELNKTEEAAEMLKGKIKGEIGVKSLRESLLKSFSPKAFRILLEMEEENIEETLLFLYENNPDYLNERDVLDVLKDLSEERGIKSNFFLFSLASSSIRNGEFENGILILRYLLKKGFDLTFVIQEFERKRVDILSIPEGLVLEAEIHLYKKEEKFFDTLRNIIERYPLYSDYVLLLLDEAGILYKEWNDKILEFLKQNIEKMNDRANILEGLALIRLNRLKEGVLKLYEAYKKGNKFVRGISKNIYKEEVPEYNLLEGFILLEMEKWKEAEKFLKRAMRDKKLLMEISRVLSEKLQKKKDKNILFLFVNTLILWGKYEEAFRFVSELKKEAEEKTKGDILAMEAVILFKKGEKEKAKEIIKSLLKEKIKFDPYFLYNFLKEEEKKEKSAFIYQTLGSLALLIPEPKEAVKNYFMLALKTPKLIPKIRDIFFTIETKFPYFPEIDLYKKGLNILEDKEDKNSLLKFYEENPEIKEEFRNLLEILPDTQKDPYLLFLLSKFNFEIGKEFTPYLLRSFELALKERLYDLLKEIKDFSYERIKNNENGKELLFFILKNDVRDFERFFKLLKEKNYIEKYPGEVVEIMRELFLKGIRDKEFLFTYADFLSEKGDKGCIYIYQELMDKVPEEIEKRRDKWEKFIPEGLGLGLNVIISLKDIQKFKERVKRIVELDLVGTFYAVIRESIKIFDYEEELYNIYKQCASYVKDVDTEIYILQELAKKEGKIEYYEELVEKLILFKRDEVNTYWREFVKKAVEEKRTHIIDRLFEKYFQFDRKMDFYSGNYLKTFFNLEPLRFLKFLKGKRNFPLPLREP